MIGSQTKINLRGGKSFVSFSVVLSAVLYFGINLIDDEFLLGLIGDIGRVKFFSSE